MRVGYARVSTGEQKLDLQREGSQEAGCKKVYQEKISGAASPHPELEHCLSEPREGDTLVVRRLDRFGQSLKDLVKKMNLLAEKGADSVLLTEGIDTTTAQGKLTSRVLRSPRGVRARTNP